MDWFNPFSENFILKKLWEFLLTIISYLNPFSENFFAYKLIELLGNLLKGLFIPDENFFSDTKETLLSDLESKLPYNDYVTMFGTISDVSSDGELDDISINNYQVGDLSLNVSNFIDFSFITDYKETWYSWVRGFVFIFLIIYHINQLTKFLRGFNIADGSAKSSDVIPGQTSLFNKGK